MKENMEYMGNKIKSYFFYHMQLKNTFKPCKKKRKSLKRRTIFSSRKKNLHSSTARICVLSKRFIVAFDKIQVYVVITTFYYL